MRGYMQVVSTLLFFAVVYWLATRSTRRARKAARHGGNGGDGGWAPSVDQRLVEVEQVTVHQDDRLTQVEQRLAALEQDRAPLYRVQ